MDSSFFIDFYHFLNLIYDIGIHVFSFNQNIIAEL